jgi:hypothetical protein
LKYLLSFDPGKSSGITLWQYADDSPAERIGAWQVEGGAEGLRDWIEHVRHKGWSDRFDEEVDIWYFHGLEVGDNGLIEGDMVTVVSEKFTPLQNKGFSLTMDSVAPLIGEGVLIAFGLLPNYDPDAKQPCYQRPSEMYWCGGKTKAEKLKNSRAWLKEHGLLLTGKQVGCKDADDANSSTLHALTWFRKQSHMPSIEKFWPKGEE